MAATASGVKIAASPTGHITVTGTATLSADYVTVETLDLSSQLGEIFSVVIGDSASVLFECREDKSTSNYTAATVAIEAKHGANAVTVADNTDVSTVICQFTATGSQVLS